MINKCQNVIVKWYANNAMQIIHLVCLLYFLVHRYTNKTLDPVYQTNNTKSAEKGVAKCSALHCKLSRQAYFFTRPIHGVSKRERSHASVFLRRHQTWKILWVFFQDVNKHVRSYAFFLRRRKTCRSFFKQTYKIPCVFLSRQIILTVYGFFFNSKTSANM